LARKSVESLAQSWRANTVAFCWEDRV